MYKNLFAVIVFAGICFGFTSNARLSAQDQLTPHKKTNVVFVFIDDMGWGDLGCYGNDFVETPHIDQLAKRGIRFTDFYASGPVCSATRCAVQSGQNQARLGITDFIPGHWRPFEKVMTPRPRTALPREVFTMGEAMQSAGYKTGYIGKWHLGNDAIYLPDQQGYDLSAVINGPHLPGRYRVQGKKVQGNPAFKPKKGQFRTDFEAELSIKFIRDHRDQPFFLMLSPFAVHIPLAAHSEKVRKYREKAEKENRDLPHPVYAAMIEHCDDMVGRIVSTLDELNLSEQTLLVFTSDNGGLIQRYDYRESADDIVSSLKPLRGEKGSLHEGGIRVPMIACGPSWIPAGSVCSEPAISHDFYPTFVDLGHGSLPDNQPIDGKSLMPLLKGSAKSIDRNALYWHYPHYHHDRPASCIRERDWKLIQYLDGSNDIQLFNLPGDIGEQKNLAESKPGRAADLLKKLKDWRTDVVATMPLPNPAYDPQRADQWFSRNGKPVPSDKRTRFPSTELSK